MSYSCFVENGVGIVRLERPEKLNALNIPMLRGIGTVLENWQSDENIHWILLEGEGRAFCAGGDVTSLLDYDDLDEAMTIFEIEFALDLLLHHYPKPVIVHYHGATMGGGIGLGGNAALRICDETTLWATPEAPLGFPPDVGLGYFISKLPRAEALYLTLSAGRLQGADLPRLNLADLYIQSADWPTLRQQLIEHPSAMTPASELLGSLSDIAYRYQQPDTIITEHQEKRPLIEKYFNQPSLKAIFDTLAAGEDDFAKTTLAKMQISAPLTLAVIFEKYEADQPLTRREVLRRDLFFLRYFFANGTMQEGIRTTLVDKDATPHYIPARLADVDLQDVRQLMAKSLSET